MEIMHARMNEHHADVAFWPIADLRAERANVSFWEITDQGWRRPSQSVTLNAPHNKC